MKDLWRIITFTKSLWRYYLGISIFTILLAVMTQIQPLLTKGAIDQISRSLGGGHANVKLVALFVILIFLTDFAQTILSNIGGYIGDVMSQKLMQNLSEKYYRHVLSLPQGYFDKELSGKIVNRMSRGIGQIGNFMQIMSNNFLQFLFSTILSLAVVAYFSWQVALMLLLLYPIFIWLTSRTSNKWQEYQKVINKHQDIMMGRFTESVGQIRVVKSFLQEARELKFFGRHVGEVIKTTYPQSKLWHKQDIVRRLVLNVIFLAVYAYIFIAAAHGKYSIGTMVLLIQYATLIRIPIFSISFLVDQSQRAVSNSKDYFEVIDTNSAIVDNPGAKNLAVSKGEIVFDNVQFGYDQKSSVLNGISFTVKPDTKVALVGESGEGKTTITNLLLRLYDVDGGRILIDGQSVGDVTQESLRQNIGVVFQEPALFSGTIRENIAYSDPDASDQAVIAAAKAANAHDFVSKLGKGYDTQIGERGLRLSGGQKQRIAIARALLKNAPILILDEATSSLDNRSEHAVQEALQRLMQGRTTLIIAHRLSTIAHVDQIITLKNGTVEQTGSPEKLAHIKGTYADLLKLQETPTEDTKKKLKRFEISA